MFGQLFTNRAERTAAWMGRRREITDIGRMSTVHIRMRNAAEYAEIVSMLPKQFEIGRRGVTYSGIPWKELIGLKAESVADCKNPARFRLGIKRRSTRRRTRDTR